MIGIPVTFAIFISSALGGMRALKLPSFPNGMCLIDYVPDVCSMLEHKVC